MFIGQFLKGNIMEPIKIHNGGNYAHAQDSNAYNFCYNPSHKLLRPMRKMVLFRLATSNVKLLLETIWSG